MVVECAPAAVFRELAEPVLRAGKKLVVLSSGALLRRPDRTGAPARRPDHRAVRRHPGTGRDHRRRRGRDPFGHDDHAQARARPAGRPYLADNNIDLTGITEPRLVFRGSPRGRRRFPGQPAWRSACRWPASATGPRWKSGPTRRWNAISTASRWIRTRPRSRWKSRTSLGQSQDRPHHRAKRHRRAAQADRPLRGAPEHAGGGVLRYLYAAWRRGIPPSAPPTTCPSHPAPAGGYGTHPASSMPHADQHRLGQVRARRRYSACSSPRRSPRWPRPGTRSRAGCTAPRERQALLLADGQHARPVGGLTQARRQMAQVHALQRVGQARIILRAGRAGYATTRAIRPAAGRAAATGTRPRPAAAAAGLAHRATSRPARAAWSCRCPTAP